MQFKKAHKTTSRRQIEIKYKISVVQNYLRMGKVFWIQILGNVFSIQIQTNVKTTKYIDIDVFEP